ncbi:hypothetical protein GCM10010116_37790 [Microbispora rosea subsp. aerata]|nr:DUF418 domain-containing protein [Microbispora rosea]GGO18773.1 hypothetical protein GCM10010116_37790 [Microbispora rosea subsp. aerata]GIH54324.1 hypothetical protein Mro02_12380 [Microbispora rosea subsp. aerata]GLJ81294.1 hypothetical protein GCM10017588_00170 [Microbispora rosea subsp. aerata]
MSVAVDRIRRIDALRGFAVCGIMLVNAWQQTVRREPTSLDWVMANLFQSRFYPMFAFLFGVSFALFLRSARLRTRRPRVVMLRRLAVLAALGAAHTVIDPGEVLLPYALLGAVVLIPASFLPRWAVLLVGCGTLVAAVLDPHPYVLITALFLLGLAAAPGMEAGREATRLGGADGLGGGPFLAVVCGTAAVLSAGLIRWWNNAPPGGGVYQAAGLCGAIAYGTAFLLVARRMAVFEALGRMTLTNYVTGTTVIVVALPLLEADRTGAAIVVLAAVTVIAQAIFCRWWLARHRYGPLEWIWRALTWWGVPPTGQTVIRDPRSAVPDPRRPLPGDQPRDRA